MRPYDIISRKVRGESLSREEIHAFVRGVVDGSFEDCQTGALLMAIRLNGMDDRETLDLTLEMAHSGRMLDLSGLPGVKVDKHSSGGVGDTVTLVAAPLMAACGLTVAKMSGRGLGFTGGTLDKLESIPGMRVDLSAQEFMDAARETRLVVTGQAPDLAPADGVLYAMRDVTATVDAMPLIISSILSKKLAAGCDAVLLDVKTGAGAVMPRLEDSVRLARQMVKIGCGAGRKFRAMVTDMSQPLGMYIGNALEVEEAVYVLSGQAGGPLKDLALRVCAQMLVMGGLAESEEAGLNAARNALDSGAGLRKLADMIRVQGGDERVAYDPGLLPKADEIISIPAERSGYLSLARASDIGSAARCLGAGRARKSDSIDPAVGIVLKKRVGDPVEKGEALALLHVNPASDLAAARECLRTTFQISPDPVESAPLIHALITEDDV